MFNLPILVQFFSRFFFHFSRFLLRPIEILNPRLYMAMYLRLLAIMGVKFEGDPRYISIRARFDDFDRVTMSDRVVISEGVVLLTHDYSVTTGLIACGNSPDTDVAFIKDIYISNNVFVGWGSIIMPGTRINENVIVGAGSVVRGEIPANSIVIGNPARVVSGLLDKADFWKDNLDAFSLRIDKK